MARWEPDASGRLRSAATQLYLERGFEQTTVAEIAERAGLTARTFFRYFADKREVLFGGSELLQARMVDAVAAAPGTEPMQAIDAALDAAAEMLGGDRSFSRTRQAVIVANDQLRERELIKMATVSVALADALRGRGVDDTVASLSAELGVAVLRIGFESWVADGETRELATIMHDLLEQLADVAIR